MPPVVATPAPPLKTQLADFDAALVAAKSDIDALKIAPLKASLIKELAALKAAGAKIAKLKPDAAATAIAPALVKAKELAARAKKLSAEAPDVLKHQDVWAVKPLAAVTKLIGTKGAQAKAIMEPQLAKLRKRAADLDKAVKKGDFKTAEAISEELFFATAGATRAANEFAADFPAYKVERDKAEKAIKALKAHKQAKSIAAEIKSLQDKLVAADAVASKADLEGWKKATIAVKQLPELCDRVRCSPTSSPKPRPGCRSSRRS